MDAKKQVFTFPETETAAETRIARALEFIAHYLGQIEGHLGSLAERAETYPVGETIHDEVLRVLEFLEPRIPKND